MPSPTKSGILIKPGSVRWPTEYSGALPKIARPAQMAAAEAASAAIAMRVSTRFSRAS